MITIESFQIKRLRFLLWLENSILSDFIEPIVIILLGIIAVIVLALVDHETPATVYTEIASISLFQAFAMYVIKQLRKQNHILIELTVAYIMGGEKLYIDQLLGKLISGDWKRKDIKPGHALFTVLEKYCDATDYWMKRRICEALPALICIDTKNSINLLKKLRLDYDPSKWKDDNRRRAIESLGFTVDGSPNIFKINDTSKNELLELMNGDQIYTAIALAEVIFELRYGTNKDKQLHESLMSKLLHSWRSEFRNAGELDVLTKLSELESIEPSNLPLKIQKHREFLKSPNLYIKIIGARQLHKLGFLKAAEVLSLMKEYLSPTNDRNVRRPIARENSVRYIIKCLDNPLVKKSATEILEDLLLDRDDIIRITAFDMMDSLSERKDMGNFIVEICSKILESETNVEFAARVEKFKTTFEKK